MVKPKKGKKTSEMDTTDEPMDTGAGVAKDNDSDSSEPEVRAPKPEKKKGKGKERAKKKSVSVDTDSDEAEPVPVASKGGFALLMGDDDSDDDRSAPVIDDVNDDDSDPPPTNQKAKPTQDQGGKKSKKGKKKKDDDDEDIDKVLAELQLEYSGNKPAEDVAEPVIDKKEAKKAKQKEKKKAIAAMEVDGATAVSAEPDQPQEDQELKIGTQKKKDKKKDMKRDKKEDTPEAEAEEEGDEGEDDKKGKKKKKNAKDDKGKDGKGPGKKTIAAMQEALKKLREEEERLKKEEEEKIAREEEEQRKREEAVRLEKERKEKKKQKEKERKERMKAEGRLLTAKQKQDKARAQELINALRAQGLELPERTEKTVRPGTRIKQKKSTQQEQPKPETEVMPTVAATPEVEVVIVDTPVAPAEEIKDTWDADSSEDEGKDAKVPDTVDSSQVPAKLDTPPPQVVEKQASVEKSASSDEDDDDDDDSNEEDDSEDESDEESGEDEGPDQRSVAEKRRDRALARIEKRKEEAEKKRSLDYLRAAVVCVLGHVDTGKTKILDKLRRTNVQVGEAGGITQQIGATNVPIENIKDNCKLVKGFADMELKLPGLLIIDTPGHESFSNLRSRGSSLCDIAILVVDIMHGLEPQTLESINLLKTRKTPFIVALNKIDRLYDWQTMGRKDVRDIIKAQAENTQREFEQRTKQVILEFAEQGLNASLFYDSPDLRSYVSLVPTSAITGEGMGNLLSLIVEFCQTMLAKRLMYSELLQATVLEVKQIPGLGTTIDCILINGKLAEGDTVILAGTDGPVVTQIRSLLMPQPMKELRVKNAYIEYKEIKAAQGVKIAGKDLEKAIAGLNLQVAAHPDEVDIYCEEVAKELKTALSTIKLKDRGVYVQASTLGSLEALLEFLRTSKIPVSGIRIGPVVKKDVMKASIMLEHESQYATILAFDVKIERDAQELADSLGVKIFQADIIYHLFDKFMAYREELKQKKREEFKNIAVFPCKIRILPQFIFNSRDPIVVGVMIEAGIVKEGTPLCVPSKEFLFIGTVSSIEMNHKNVDMARKGQEVCLKIENTTGEAPKMFGRHFDHTDIVTSRISRQSIDACKDYFRDDLSKGDWQLMVELKKLFEIM